MVTAFLVYALINGGTMLAAIDFDDPSLGKVLAPWFHIAFTCAALWCHLAR